MTYVCLWSPGWRTGAGPGLELGESLLEVAPRIAVERRGVVWADARGLPAEWLARELVARATRLNDASSPAANGLAGVAAGIAAIPVAAELAARTASGDVVWVPPGGERDFVALQPLELLEPDARTLPLLHGVGVTRCGELAALDREAVEVRFGPDGVVLWRLARCADARRLFAPIPPERPHASLDFVDYVVTDPERLVFTAHALLGTLCEALRARGEHARSLRLRLPLASGEVWEREVRAARGTASRDTWLRLVRAVLERLTVPDAVAGMALELETTEPAAAIQGDLFDRGFATASAVEAALARIAAPAPSIDGAHPLLERRRSDGEGERESGLEHGRERGGEHGREPGGSSPGPAATAATLTLQLLAEPRPIQVDSAPLRDHTVPIRYRELTRRKRKKGVWRAIATAAGPDRVSGGQWEPAPYAREYFRCVTDDGVLVWLFREGRSGDWFLHGWWD